MRCLSFLRSELLKGALFIGENIYKKPLSVHLTRGFDVMKRLLKGHTRSRFGSGNVQILMILMVEEKLEPSFQVARSTASSNQNHKVERRLGGTVLANTMWVTVGGFQI